MKAYIRNEEFAYPEDVKQIYSYLSRHGTLNISLNQVVECYEWFSESVYCAGWMGVTTELLKEFADWLAEKEIEECENE